MFVVHEAAWESQDSIGHVCESDQSGGQSCSRRGCAQPGNGQKDDRSLHCKLASTDDEFVHNSLQSERGIDAVLRIRRNQEIRSDVHAGAGTLFERDDGQPVEKVIQHLLTLDG